MRTKGRLARCTIINKRNARRLARLYEDNRDKGTVYVQMKRYVGRLAAVRRRKPERQAEAAQGQEPRCLVRARSNKRKSKISAVIPAADLVRFQLAIGNIMRLHMDGLKRMVKKKEKADKKAGGSKAVKQAGSPKAEKKEESPKKKAK